MAYKRYRKQEKLDLAMRHRRKFVIVNWKELPVAEQERIYNVEMGSYTQLYVKNMAKIKKGGLSSDELNETLDNAFTSLFMRYACKRKFGKPWHLVRAQVNSFLLAYKHKSICYAYFLKHYRDNPDVFDMYVNEFDMQFGFKSNVVNITRMDPALKKFIMINRLGGHRHAGAGI